MILVDERRVRQLPAWRLRAARATAGSAAILVLATWTLSTGASYKLVSHFVHMRPVTAVTTTHPEVGVLIDAPARQLPTLASALSQRGLHASFAVDRSGSSSTRVPLTYGDQLLPRLPNGGLVRWMGERGQLHHWLRSMGYGRHFLYASHGPNFGQWLVAHGAGGRLIAGAVRIIDRDDSLGSVRPGEVIELSVATPQQWQAAINRLSSTLRNERLSAVPVGRLMRDAGPRV
jgi:hypothetical protein